MTRVNSMGEVSKKLVGESVADNKPALVAMLDKPETRRGTVSSTLDYLRKVADRKGISFYAHTTFCPSKN
jgi:hypothetical protein